MAELDPVCDYLNAEPGGLWSVSKTIDVTTMYSDDSSHASVRARTSLYICVYLVSVGGIALT